MKIPEDNVPTNLNEAVEFLKSNLEKDDVEFIRDELSGPHQCHFSLGMSLRNEWSLWEKDTHLVKWFKSEYGIDHADDISGVILDTLWRDVRGEPRRDKQLAEKYKAHWESESDWKEGQTKYFELDKDGNITEIKDNKNE